MPGLTKKALAVPVKICNLKPSPSPASLNLIFNFLKPQRSNGVIGLAGKRRANPEKKTNISIIEIFFRIRSGGQPFYLDNKLRRNSYL
jgi:hypothetical protein